MKLLKKKQIINNDTEIKTVNFLEKNLWTEFFKKIVFFYEELWDISSTINWFFKYILALFHQVMTSTKSQVHASKYLHL